MDKREAIQIIKLLDAFIGLNEVGKIISSFLIPLKERSILKEDGHYYIHGNFNIGGTVSGRLSSSKINLQNIPSGGSRYATIVKECFIAPEGYLFVGADYDSLEDKISALTTRDPNKLKVYTDGYDGHCLRAFYYFKDEMPDIVAELKGFFDDPTTSGITALEAVEIINSIDDRYSVLRQESKAPTFALTYQGTEHTLVNTVGMTLVKANAITANYHELYKVSDQWVQDRLEEATHCGYVTTAFGLRIRTPILGQTIIGQKTTPYEAQKEGRTAGNGLGQGYGMLNQRSTNEFMERVYASKYKYLIHPKAQIHDAAYLDVINSVGAIKWVNDNLVDCMNWTGLPEIQHPDIPLGGKLHVYHPNWDPYVKLPNGATQNEIYEICKQ